MSDFKNNTKETLTLPVAVKRILFENWDPIGVRNIPGAQTEYDGYVSKICRMIETSSSESAIFNHLWEIETNRMALPGNRENTITVAAMLYALGKEGKH